MWNQHGFFLWVYVPVSQVLEDFNSERDPMAILHPTFTVLQRTHSVEFGSVDMSCQPTATLSQDAWRSEWQIVGQQNKRKHLCMIGILFVMRTVSKAWAS